MIAETGLLLLSWLHPQNVPFDCQLGKGLLSNEQRVTSEHGASIAYLSSVSRIHSRAELVVKVTDHASRQS